MRQYIARRLIQLIPVLFGASLIVFMLVQLIPGDSAAVLLGPHATDQQVADLREDLGLNDPFYMQYFTWVGRAARGDLGNSLQYGTPVTSHILSRLPNTMLLTSVSITLAIVVGSIAGIISATRQYSLYDRGAMVLALFGNSMPSFWLGMVLILVFSIQLGWFPAGGFGSARQESNSVLELARYLVLPGITMSAVATAIIARMMRSSMLEVIRQDYMMTARAKGMKESRVIVRHALRNALLPVTTVVGLQLGFMLTGSVLTETVFNWPGLGLEIKRAIEARDIPMIQGFILFLTFVFVTVNLLVDVAYAYMDPRIRYE